jgi:hypothetical protein
MASSQIEINERGIETHGEGDRSEKGKYDDLEVSGAKRLQALEDENTRLKKLLAEAMLDNAMPKEAASKNGDARC